jgi:hypothetical protein
VPETDAIEWGEATFQAALERVAAEGVIDARGVRLSSDQLRQLLDAAPEDPQHPGRRLLREADFFEATFKRRPGHEAVHPEEDARETPRPATAAGGRVDVSSVRPVPIEPSGDPDFREATFESVSFIGATFEGNAAFGGATFGGDAAFHGATFGGDAAFRRATFGGDALFVGATFSGDAAFSDATFGGDAGFSGATFSGDAEFGEATFSESVGFIAATFGRNARFRGATLSGHAEFGEATFSGHADFGEATFSGHAGFGEATFSGHAGFGEATFSGHAGFGEATFSGLAGFGGATFEHADFGKATFSDDAGFYEATFSDDAGFFEATFSGTAVFGQATFKADTTFRGATFSGDGAVFDATFGGDAGFDDAAFSGRVAAVGGATFGGDAAFRRATFGGVGDFAGATFSGDAAFTGATFSGEAAFIGATFSGDAAFGGGGVTFSGDAYFAEATFGGDAAFGGATFRGGVYLDRASFSRDADFREATFERVRQLGSFFVFGQLALDEAVFARPVRIEVSARRASLARAAFRGGVDLFVRWAEVSVEDADFPEPSLLAELPALPGLGGEPSFLGREEPVADVGWVCRLDTTPVGFPPRVVSVRRAKLARLTLSGVDLRACRFAGSHGLDALRLERVLFAQPPSGRWRRLRWTRRRTIAEEHHWRAEHGHGRGWYEGEVRAPDWVAPASEPPPAPEQIAGIYRDLRKGREDSRDEPGAADFYYGEMEMRSHAAKARRRFRRIPGIEEAVLWLYWLVSGYGLRASRALVALATTIGLGAVLLGLSGFDAGKHPDDGTLLFAAESSISVLRAPDTENLTAVGHVVQIALRLAGPLFFGLALLSLRGRVKR